MKRAKNDNVYDFPIDEYSLENFKQITEELVRDSSRIEEKYQEVRKKQTLTLIENILKIKEELVNKIGCLDLIEPKIHKFPIKPYENFFDGWSYFIYISKSVRRDGREEVHFGYGDDETWGEINEESLIRHSYEQLDNFYKFLKNDFVDRIDIYISNYLEGYREQLDKMKQEIISYNKKHDKKAKN